MTDNPESIIDEYLALVREKLPLSIADDVITELETYMLETARDQGEDGQITFESAKKVVAQFGAPGEVANEYRYSMFPETFPDEDIPTEIIHDTNDSEPILIVSVPEKKPPKMVGVNPTTNYPTFFFKSLILTIMWAVTVSATTFFVSPIGLPWYVPNWQLFMIITQVCFGTIVLLVHTLNLKRKKVILWKRSYPDWSIFQKLVTLPENSVPDGSNTIRLVDIAVSFVGVFLYTPIILQWNHPWYILLGIPAVLLLVSRLVIVGRKLDRERDPYEKSRLEFAINFSLLVILNATVFWLFVWVGEPWTIFIYWIMPPFVIFVPLFGTVLLLQLLTGTQNLWWEKDDQDSVSIEKVQKIKSTTQKNLSKNARRMFLRISGWMVIFNSIAIVESLLIESDFIIGGIVFERIFSPLLTIGLVGLLVSLYSLFRNFLITHWKSTTFVGNRSRLESVIDFGVSSFVVGGFILLFQQRVAMDYIGYMSDIYTEIHGMNFQIAGLIASSEMIAMLIVIVAYVVRTLGNILEFIPKYKMHASQRIEESGVFALMALSLIIGEEFIKYTYYYNFSLGFVMMYISYMIIAVFLAFQVVSSGMKVNELREIPVHQNIAKNGSRNEINDYSRIAN